jgi:hypothetical protein
MSQWSFRLAGIFLGVIAVSSCGAGTGDATGETAGTSPTPPPIESGLQEAVLAQPSVEGAAAANAAATEGMACRFLTVEEVAAVLRGSFRVVVAFEDGRPGDPSSAGCSFETDDINARPTLVRLRAHRSTTEDADPFRPGGTARQQFERARIASPGTREIRGLGEAAFAADGAMHLLRGDVYLVVDAYQPDGRPATDAELRPLAEKALGRLP